MFFFLNKLILFASSCTKAVPLVDKKEKNETYKKCRIYIRYTKNHLAQEKNSILITQKGNPDASVCNQGK